MLLDNDNSGKNVNGDIALFMDYIHSNSSYNLFVQEYVKS